MKYVIVTGAASGIGKTIAEQFIKQNYYVFLLDKKDSIEGHFSYSSSLYSFHQVDVSSEDSIRHFFRELADEKIKIDLLINNAGISEFVPFDDLTLDSWDKVINTNLRSAVIMSKKAVPVMKKDSSIINIASTRAAMSEPGSEAYAASKGGLVSLTHALAASLADRNIRVNCISPGWIHTGSREELIDYHHSLHWSGRVGSPEDVASVCTFLADEKNKFINGENITIDGGMTRKMRYD
ncbi:SDR family oxidoreductase [Alkalicoccus halolimnae]|uniref:SDR family oxidoreductase n=1 Tax=Alkalicoccus halolimnae TaxID=1667239 RepID=A0A5C7FDR6_9BACI|nr:SDR family oxidoreductase [Alkalicoccus halolimnae]TXF83067.1 SDR family oxidoreductase [Alkalicoccus halolimnae]